MAGSSYTVGKGNGPFDPAKPKKGLMNPVIKLDKPFINFEPQGPGLRVRLSAIPGLTEPGILKKPFYFPCPPLDEWTYGGTYSHSDYDTVNAGQFSRRGGRQLQAWGIDTILPDDAGFDWIMVAGFDNKMALVRFLEDIRDSGSPVHFLATHHYDLRQPEKDMPVTLRDFTVTERHAELDARYVSLAFTEFRDPIVKRNANASSQRAPGEVSGGTRPDARHRVYSKDFPVTITLGGKDRHYSYTGLNTRDEPLSLQVIAKYVYGDAGAVPQIRNRLRPAIPDWGASAPLSGHPTFRKGGKIICPPIRGIRGD